MDIIAHGLWAGAGAILAQRYNPIPRGTVLAIVAMAVLPDIPHLIPVVGWSLFGDGSAAAIRAYAMAVAGNAPAAPPDIDSWSHNLHCVMHSAVIAGLVTLLSWWRLRYLWLPLLGWWSHIVIDVFTHAVDYFPSPVLYPFTRKGFDGLAWTNPWFMVGNYTALVLVYGWLAWHRRTTLLAMKRSDRCTESGKD
ncbi:MAG: zinc dependent phospholipase C family protein [Rhodoferax sp.]|nr:zinc dependent phospholipase C family protein [Rhodoferax sp.]